MNALFRTSATRAVLRSATAASRVPAMGARRTVMTLSDVKYTAHASASGQGRNGEVKSDDDSGLKLRLAMPQSLGGKGDGANPEQLFAMGYAACFLSALQLVAGQQGKAEVAKNATIRTSVHIGTPKDGKGFGLAVDLTVNGVDDQKLVDDAHATCPYSRMLKDGAVVNVSMGGEPNPGPSNSQKDSGSDKPSESSSKSSSSSASMPATGPLSSPEHKASAEKSSSGSKSTSESSSEAKPHPAAGSSSGGDTDASGTSQSGSGTGGYQ